MMEFWTNHALNKTWRQFGYINHAWHLGFKDDMIIYAHDLNQLQIMWEAYKHFFNVKGEPIFIKEDRTRVEFRDYYANVTKQNLWHIFRLYRKKPRKITHPIAYSIADVKNSQRYGIDGLLKESILKSLNGFDLGNTRDFKDADELIDKLTKLSTAEVFLGSHCSWAFLSPYFDTPWIELHEIKLNYLKH